MASLTPEDYTVAWVCALPLEAAAARVMLDKIHSPPQEISDQNAYDFGELYGHNIVIAYLPSGLYGKVSAAGVVSRMRSTFRELRFALMVGIGGGVPGTGKNDIRLGDVVVSKPGPRHSGVIQYDYGKAIQGGIEAKKLTAQDGEDGVLNIVQQVLENNSHMRAEFGAPKGHTDLLFHPSYRHTEGDSCDTCDKEWLVNRQPRGGKAPHIHYGLIASGDQVTKDSQTRDRLAEQHGILCFEMEAVGLMDELPTLVIRGICDYCDSHKQKQWQGYAALTAAAWAKALLSVVPAYHGSSSIKKAQRHWVVPLARNPRFVGRNNEIAQLEHLITTQDGPRRVAITGLGGVGKTQIALEVAYRTRDRDKDCSLFWIPCTSQTMIDQAFLNIAQALGERRTLASDFDNADDSEMWLTVGNNAGLTLEDFLPQSSLGRILFTTRNRKLAIKLAPFDLMPIPDEDKETAFQVLREMLGHDLVAEETSAAFLEQLAYLPLAITQASAYIAENGLNLSTYLELFQEHEHDAVELLSEDFRDPGRYKDMQNPVITTWLLSFKQIQHQNPLAADYLSFKAIIDPRNIPMSILSPGATRKQQLEALGLLNAYSFTAGQHTAINMHRLVHLATRNWLRQNGLFDHWVGEVADRMGDVFPNYDSSNWRLWREYLPHGLSLVQDAAFACHEDSHTKLIERIAGCLKSDGRYLEAEAFYARLVIIYGRGAAQDHHLRLDNMAQLAFVYLFQGRWRECDELYLQVFDGQTRLLGASHPLTIATLRIRAASCVCQLREVEAEKLALEAVELSERGLGPEDEITLLCQTDLARIYSIRGRQEHSLETCFSTIERMKTAQGQEQVETLSVMSNSASTFLDMGPILNQRK
ncbi:putative kinesin light chain [Aspergillus keveii]|uniref:Kinesin light chain n=1 Tax=Aspergillus keveii TaxID=714993 RepID=A0ABR4FIP4_9EURO